MFTLAIFIGIFSYLIFSLGIIGVLNNSLVITASLGFVVFLASYYYKDLQQLLKNQAVKKNKIFILFFLIVLAQGLINLVGALGPETGFDATWYHLTLPKLYLMNHKILFFPGSILYYSAMPKLAEMLYTSALAFGSEIFAKLVHYSFGILCCIALYKLARRFFSPTLSLVSVAIFYANLVVSWETITAYIDLVRTFYEILALSAWLNWAESKKTKWLMGSAILIGFAITTKYLAVGSLVIFLLLSIVYLIKNKVNIRKIVTLTTCYLLLAAVIPLPWMIFSYIHTGSFAYPFFTKTYPIESNFQILNPVNFLHDIWIIFARSQDPISPIYLGIFPLIVFFFKKAKKEMRYVYLFALLSLIIWYFIPRTGGGRFMLPYLPVLSVLAVFAISQTRKNLRYLLLGFVIAISLINLLYRSIANSKYIPVIFGKESKANFLSKNLNFSFGDFYDIDGYFAKNIKSTDKVLLIGFHNMYYVNFPFVDSTALTKHDTFNYISTQNTKLPNDYSNWKKVYNNPTTLVTLYKK